MKLNIGCGNKRFEDYQGVDKYKCDAADYICDLENEKLPFKDNTITAIILDNVIEHFYDIPKVINELVRVSKKGTIIKIIKIQLFRSIREKMSFRIKIYFI